jgi:hypothetical protein
LKPLPKSHPILIERSAFYGQKIQQIYIQLFLSFLHYSFNAKLPIFLYSQFFSNNPDLAGVDSNSEPDLVGCKIFCREISQSYDYATPSGEAIDIYYTIYDLDENKTYCFVVRAFNTKALRADIPTRCVMDRWSYLMTETFMETLMDLNCSNLWKILRIFSECSQNK